MMGLSQGGSTEALTLDTLRDPTAYAERLKKLEAETDRAKLVFEQAKQENASVVAERKKIEELHGSVMEALQKINEAKAEVAKREEGLTYRSALLDTREGGLNAREASIEANAKQVQAKLDEDTANLTKWKADFAAKVDHDTDDIAQQLASKSAELDRLHKARMDEVDKNFKVAEAAKKA